ncbi:DegT/DnrJ/EryC1/StrS aminotransferase family protein [Jiella endophytica]|uniref:DegT/DnrJ/EryC1/StrS aminotransferase family protein n=1 Tax=Jiella endophytica TaxID=2558362 RepID=A0A4Y8RMF2_9HYPH|nr:DegT/DnrJ/EryC1/StrS family aminotransferase [Jiella endophytica]TFF23303.1 DegT/DnrJ/EryC1/StrS aminotransferase family protein [Jiella endophytica]
MPWITADQPGYGRVLEGLAGDAPFTFCKINHGFWERLARLERLGIGRADFATADGAELDRILGIEGSRFAEGGMVADLLAWMADKPDLRRGLCFVPSLEPWPNADRIEGTPMEHRATCESLIRAFVPAGHLADLAAAGFSGHELKVAIITGGIARLLDALKGRQVIVMSNAQNRAFIDVLEPASVDVIDVHPKEARLDRDDIRERLFAAIALRQDAPRPPVVLASAGGAMSTWLAFQAWERFARLHFIDLGGAMAAFHRETAKTNWIVLYRRQIAESLARIPAVAPRVPPALRPKASRRDTALLALARDAGVSGPKRRDEVLAPVPELPIPFIENKTYDHSRLGEFLALSVAENHHANGGPLVRLLERAVETVMGLPETRRVVAVSSGTAGLHLSCGWHRVTSGATRWVTSAFNFFSAGIGPLAETLVLDCDADGRFDLDALKALPRDSYDGVVYTNVFAQQANWDRVAKFCRRAGKALVVDNATGLLDRPKSALLDKAPLEVVSAHHTKPWGVGEGGFVVCDEDQAETIRNLANFSARLDPSTAASAQNAKLSDLAAAAILDRLERMADWGRLYALQERRMKSLMIDADLGIEPFGGLSRVRSPRAHTAFLAPWPVDIHAAAGPVTLRKYYRPLRTAATHPLPTPVADDLYARIFSLSNAPEMRLVANGEIIDQVQRMVRAGR